MSAQHGSFRRASAALNVQQSTASRCVRNLEHRVGTELFERDHAGIRPTAAGDRFLKDAALGFDRLRRALQRAEALQRGEHGELTVALSVPLVLLGDLFERFREHFGGVSVEIVEGTSRASQTLVQQRTVDVAFVAKTNGDRAPRSLHLWRERMMAVLPASHPLAKSSSLTLEDLRSERFLLGASGLGPDIE